MHVVDICALKICIMYWHFKARSILELSSHLCIFVSVCSTVFTMLSFIWLPENVRCLQSMRHLTKHILHSCHCPLGPISCLTLQLEFFRLYEKPDFHVITWQKSRIISIVFVYIIWVMFIWIKWRCVLVVHVWLEKLLPILEFIILCSKMCLKNL